MLYFRLAQWLSHLLLELKSTCRWTTSPNRGKIFFEFLFIQRSDVVAFTMTSCSVVQRRVSSDKGEKQKILSCHCQFSVVQPKIWIRVVGATKHQVGHLKLISDKVVFRDLPNTFLKPNYRSRDLWLADVDAQLSDSINPKPLAESVAKCGALCFKPLGRGASAKLIIC